MARWFTRTAAIGAVAALAVGVTVAITQPAFAQEQAQGGPMQRFIAKLAQNLGIGEDQLREGIKSTQLQFVDEAVAQGRIPAERAELARQRIEQGRGGFGPAFFGPRGGPGERGRPGQQHAAMGVQHAGIQAVTQLLGLDQRQLMGELRGKTLAEVGADHGKSREEVGQAYIQGIRSAVDEAVANGRLTRERGDEAIQKAEQNLDQVLDRRIPSGPPARNLRGGIAGLGAVAELFGVTPQQLHTELRGKTLVEVGEAHGKTRDEISATLMQSMRDGIERAVADGKLTRERADQMLAQAQERIGQMLDRRWPERGRP